MNNKWENKFVYWTKGLSDTEEAMCENAERMIKNAIKEDTKLSNKNIEVFVQGSYRNNTNVKQNSDVDICVVNMGSFFYELPPEKNKNNFHIIGADYQYNEFKNDIEIALINKFGRSGVTRGNKAFDVHSNTYRVDADVVVCLEHRRYTGIGLNYLSGTELMTDDGRYIINWPKQHYENGVNKNVRTNTRYKKVVRIFKRLNLNMQEEGILVSKKIPSFLIECLIWNTPDHFFKKSNYVDTIRDILVFLYNETNSFEKCEEWGEVSDLKYLFRDSQPWKLEDANNFILEAWRYIGYE